VEVTKEIHEVLRENSIVFTEDTIWYKSIHSKGQDIGWKIHLSSTLEDFQSLATTVIPLLKSYNFKVIKNSNLLSQLNSGYWGDTQVGKCFTIYPNSEQEAYDICKILILVTSGLSGPMIPTDVHIGGVVYIRHGVISGTFGRDRFGLATRKIESTDVVDLYTSPEAQKATISASKSVLGELVLESRVANAVAALRRYKFESILRRKIQGCTYKVRCNDVELIFKEGRQHVLTSVVDKNTMKNSSIDGFEQMKREYEMMQYISNININAEPPIDIFQVDMSMFIVCSFFHGHTMANIDANKKYSIREKINLFRVVLDFSERLHENDVIHRDLSPNNIMIDKNKIKIIDWGQAFHNRIHTYFLAGGTPGFYSPQQMMQAKPSTSDDIFSLGGTFLYFMSGLDPLQLGITVNNPDQLSDIIGVSKELCEIISSALSHTPQNRPSIKEFTNALQKTHKAPQTKTRTRNAMENKIWIKENWEKIENGILNSKNEQKI
jgi:serine/threonine protein kinase